MSLFNTMIMPAFFFADMSLNPTNVRIDWYLIVHAVIAGLLLYFQYAMMVQAHTSAPKRHNF